MNKLFSLCFFSGFTFPKRTLGGLRKRCALVIQLIGLIKYVMIVQTGIAGNDPLYHEL